MELDWFGICCWMTFWNTMTLKGIYDALRTHKWTFREIKTIIWVCQGISFGAVGFVVVSLDLLGRL